MLDVVILDLLPERFDELEALWRALYEHHQRLTPQLRGRARSFEAAWRSRRQTERRWLATEPGSFVLAAQESERFVGYAFVRIASGVGFAESWRVSDPLAQLATLSVPAEYRGRGIGTALMDAVQARLGEMGIADMAIGVVAGNDAAMAFYERRGAVAFTTELIQRVGVKGGGDG